MSNSPEQTARTPLQPTTAMVIGASTGIGRGVVDLLADDGSQIAAFDLPQATWPTNEPRPQVSRFNMDVTNTTSISDGLAAATDTLGEIDAVINCAGVLGTVGPAVNETLERFEHLLRINLVGAFALSQTVLPMLAERRYGRLVHVASIAGKEGNPFMTGYSASKAGLIGMVKALGKEYAQTNVTVNAIAPASIETPLTAGMTPEQRETQRQLVPMRRFGTTTEAAELIRFIISPEASFTTGFVYDLSGGRASY